MGAAELAGLLRDYHGSYLLVFAGYNAGHGQVEKWIEGYGDPRDPKIDPIHWVERIPFAETRNYFQRVMENLRAYRVRFGSGTQWQQPAKMSNWYQFSLKDALCGSGHGVEPALLGPRRPRRIGGGACAYVPSAKNVRERPRTAASSFSSSKQYTD